MEKGYYVKPVISGLVFGLNILHPTSLVGVTFFGIYEMILEFDMCP